MSDAGDARGQLVAAYLASGAKVLSWAVAAAVVYRKLGPGPFALLMLLRGTLGLFNHAAFGLGPAGLHFTALARKHDVALEAEEVASRASSPTLEYANRLPGREVVRVAAGESPASVLMHAVVVAVPLLLLGWWAVTAYHDHFRWFHDTPPGVRRPDLDAVFLVGLGVLMRAAGDVAGGVSQATGRFVPDQVIAAAADLLWAALLLKNAILPPLVDVADFYAVTGGLAMFGRLLLALFAVRLPPSALVRYRLRFGPTFAFKLLAYGGLVTLGGVADFLYAPIDYVILNRLVDPLAVAVYAPAVQIDAAIILLTAAISAVVLPRSAIRHGAGDAAGVWRDYVRGSLAAAAVAAFAATLAWAFSPWLFLAWLGDDLPATRAILPLVLLHTVIGASAGVGRATLIGVGRAGAYAAAVLVGGLVNVAASLAFVSMGLGLRGVIYGTLLSVGLRCLVWMPWFVRRELAAPLAGRSQSPEAPRERGG